MKRRILLSIAILFLCASVAGAWTFGKIRVNTETQLLGATIIRGFYDQAYNGTTKDAFQLDYTGSGNFVFDFQGDSTSILTLAKDGTLTLTGTLSLLSLGLLDTDASNTLSLVWNEDDSADRTLNLLVSAGTRSLTIEADSLLNQDLTSDASPQFARMGLGEAADSLNRLEATLTAGAGAGTTHRGTSFSIDIDSLDATSVVHCFGFDGVGSTSGEVVALATGGRVQPIMQRAGTYATPSQTEYAARWPNGGAWTDRIDAQQCFVADDDEIFIGNTTPFSSIEVILTTPASSEIDPEFYYYNTGLTWVQFYPSDATNEFTNDGVISWGSNVFVELWGWKSDYDPGVADGSSGYYIKIKRTQDTVATQPTPTTIKLLDSDRYSWDYSGNLVVNDITSATLDTGQGANDLYDMDQNVLTTSTPQFARIGVGEATDAADIVELTSALTTSYNGIDLTPTGALGSSAVFRGLYLNGAALDPSAASAEIFALNANFGGVDMTNEPDIEAVYITMPASFTGQADMCAFEATGNGMIVEMIDNDKGRNAVYVEGGPVKINRDLPNTAVTTFEGISVDVDVTDLVATSIFHALDVSAVGTTSGEVAAVGTYPGVRPVHQHVGSYVTPNQTNYAARFPSGGAWTAGVDLQTIFVANNDEIYIGSTLTFSALEVALTTPASKDVFAEYYFYDTGTTWVEFFPSDSTNGWRVDGLVTWTVEDLTNWKSDYNPGGGGAGYFIKVKRTRVNSITSPVPTTVKTLDSTSFQWDESGDLTVNSLDVNDSVITGEPKHFRLNLFGPNAIQASDNEICIVPAIDAAITVTRIQVTLDAAGNDVAGDLKWADTFIGLASAAVIDAFDTTSGVLDDSSISAGSVAAGKCIYLSFDAAPNAAITQICVDVTYDYD